MFIVLIDTHVLWSDCLSLGPPQNDSYQVKLISLPSVFKLYGFEFSMLTIIGGISEICKSSGNEHVSNNVQKAYIYVKLHLFNKDYL